MGKGQIDERIQKYYGTQRALFPKRSGDKFYTYLKYSGMMSTSWIKFIPNVLLPSMVDYVAKES